MFKRLLPLLPLLLAGACDDDLRDAPDRGADHGEDADADAVSLRPLGSTAGGSTRLNTAQLFAEGMPLRHFDYDGDSLVYDDVAATRVRFRSVRLLISGSMVEFLAAGNVIKFDAGVLKINGVAYPPGKLLGSEWTFNVASSAVPSRPIVLKVSGVALVDVPGGTFFPAYNFNLVPASSFYVDGPYSSCAPLDLLTASSTTFNTKVQFTPEGVPNAFKIEYAAVFYGGVKVSDTGVVSSDETAASFACLSGAIGKAGLWGYPPWVGAFLGRTGVQQLQAASRAIRADFCGTGVSHTADGTPLQIRDRFTPAFTDPTEVTEAVWGGNGSVCKVTEDRLDSGGIYGCGTLTGSCDQAGSDWITGPDQFMWTKVDPARTSYPASHPCSSTGAIGCNDPGVQATVCAADPYCCTGAWDSICVHKVTTLGAAADACCANNGGPGCGDAAVEACVSGFDPSCSTGVWDAWCAAEVEHLGCGLCR